MGWAGHVAGMGNDKYKILFGKLEGSKSLGKPTRRRSDNVRIYRIERCGLDSSGSGYKPVEGSSEHCNEPSGSIKGGEFLEQLSYS
jgi:hypothetical protein